MKERARDKGRGEEGYGGGGVSKEGPCRSLSLSNMGYQWRAFFFEVRGNILGFMFKWITFATAFWE